MCIKNIICLLTFIFVRLLYNLCTNIKGGIDRVQKRYNLSMPFPLYEWLKGEAKKQSRSLCGQILFILTNEMDNKKAVDLSPNVPTASYQIPTKGNVYNG